MANYCSMSAKHRGGWTLIVLLVVIAIIALLMVLYLHSVLQSYAPPTITDEEGGTIPAIDHVKDQLAPIDTRNKQLDELLEDQSQSQDKQPEQSRQ